MASDLISREEAIRVSDMSDYRGLTVEQVRKVTDIVSAALRDLPAVDAVPVVHGRWLGRRYDFIKYEYVTVPYDVTTFDNPNNLFCSVCNTPALSNGCEDDVPSNYCPNCGAKMDGGGEA